MSGPMALEPGGTEHDTLTLRLAGTPARDDDTTTLRLPGRGDNEAQVSALAAELADRVGPAVHPYEVAALLEAEGMTAEQIRERYGHPNLFSLATALYEQVPRTFPEPVGGADPWRPDHVRCLLRGVLFALPGLAYLLTAPLWHPGRHADALILAGLVSWSWGQALGHRAHLQLATGHREAARTLLTGAPLGAALATATAVPLAGGVLVSLTAAAQSVYLAAAGALLVLGRERLLLAALTPLIAGAAVLPWWEPGTLLRAGPPLLALLAVLIVTGLALRARLAAPAAPDGSRPPLLRSLPYGLFGLAAGVLVLLEGRREPHAVIVLTVSMGPAEWLLYRYRGLSVAALRASATPAGFLLRSAAVLGLCLLAYLLTLLPAAYVTGAAPAALLLLAATLWTALLLQAFGTAWPPVVICLAAAGVAAAVTLLHLPPGSVVLPLCCGTAALCLVACVLRFLGRPARHA
ncbi:hypothetical protein LK07_32245 [Streptomyces pluripotens]|uniref:Uncharacterized protein n=1 Tax=Streptomyces pluripotens TaxID=1355015 RepID=A0A221P6S6_9ACTN|nr:MULTISPECIES: hypothetical protein [Streptomyces]ARP73670.1 hypothetical protein LK06_031045 [Streptomyces pluripotens]ASN27917.1 hypothetical protein LK07_32245 [Streptomyces pluripotens]KIE24370.1 hypothetical protein LK08_25205 [Streptomyces sp. MUSC 125]MCH0559478.1 hypothetical protein [Streptomyces sp. MUM 16J]